MFTKSQNLNKIAKVLQNHKILTKSLNIVALLLDKMGSTETPGLFMDTTENLCSDYKDPITKKQSKLYHTFIIAKSPSKKENLCLFYFASQSKALHIIAPCLTKYFDFVKKITRKKKIIIRSLTTDKYPIWKTICLLVNGFDWRRYCWITFNAIAFGLKRCDSNFQICNVHVKDNIERRMKDDETFEEWDSHNYYDCGDDAEAAAKKKTNIKLNYNATTEIFYYVAGVMRTEKDFNTLWKTINFFGIMLGVKRWILNGVNAGINHAGFMYGDLIGYVFMCLYKFL